MDDTAADFKSVYRQKLMERSNAERAMMGDSMFAAAREMALASLQDRTNAGEVRFRLFMRFYGNDFAPGHMQRIKELLTTTPA